MKHSQAIDSLVELPAGRLKEGERVSIEKHVSRCSTCQEWLETATLLGGAFQRQNGVEEGPSPHPHADVLALCALRPEEALEPDREGFLTHLEGCSSCQTLLDLMGEAIRQARPRRPNPSGYGRYHRFHALGASALVAAGLFAAIGAGFFYSRQHGSGMEEVHMNAAPAEEAIERARTGEKLSDVELSGTHLIEADRELQLANVKIREGARIKLRARNLVVFSDGFHVGESSSLSVEIEKSTDN